MISGVSLMVAFALLSVTLAISVRLMTESWGLRISRFFTGLVFLLTSSIAYSHLDTDSSDIDLLIQATAFAFPLTLLYNVLFWRLLVFKKDGDELDQRSFWVWFDDHRDFGAFKLLFFLLFLALARILSEALGFGEGVGGIILIIGIPVVFLITTFRLALLEEKEAADDMKLQVNEIFKSLSEEDLPEAIEKGLCLVQFHAEWCKPCKPMAITLRSVVAGRDDIGVFAVDAERDEGLLKRFRVKFLPSIVIIWNGDIIGEITGRRSKSELRRLLKRETDLLPTPSIQEGSLGTERESR